MRPPRVTILVYRIGPYHFARLRAAGQRLNVGALEFINRDSEYAWEEVRGRQGFDRQTLFRQGSSAANKPSEIAARVFTALTALQPQAVAIPGWADRSGLAALAWCSRNGVPAIVMSESTAWDEPRVAWKEAVKRSVVGLFSSALVGGNPHADYLTQLGMPSSRVFLGYDAVDNEYFAQGAEDVRNQKSWMSCRYQLPDKYFLASARFIEKKNLSRLIQAYARYRELARDSERWNLALLGDGPSKSNICELISTLRLQHSVHLPGFQQYRDLPAYFGLASAFIHASTAEPWGLVVNEAMASGLPVLVSKRCGCAADLVNEGKNGFTFDPHDVEALASLMVRFSSGELDLVRMSQASRESIAAWGPDRFAESLVHAVDAALSEGPRHASLSQSLMLRLLCRNLSPVGY